MRIFRTARIAASWLPRFARLTAAVIALLAVVPCVALARVVRVVVDQREPIAGGAPFGSAGAYERLAGRIFFAFDPSNPHDRQIVDLSRAPRNAQGEVEAWAEFVLLRPVDPAHGSGVTLVDVVNRGGMTVGVFHLDAQRGTAPTSAEFYGDALLLRRGLAVMMVGWQWDILPNAAGLHFHPPVVQSITGLVRSDITIDAPTHTIPLGHRVGASQALGYPVANANDPANVLTVRDGPLAPRAVVPRSAWRFGRDSAGQVVDDPYNVYMASRQAGSTR